jgi:ApbE superfamily uncharacterized protein (UPF0280 family)
MEPGRFVTRDYRSRAVPAGLVSFRVTMKETDLWIAAERNLADKAARSIAIHRAGIEDYIALHPGFLESLTPWREPVPRGSLVARMTEACASVEVGPMACVAGVVAQAVAEDLSRYSGRVLVENGGDIFLIGKGRSIIGLWAGPSPLSGRLGLALDPGSGMSVCSSSGTVGPSLSFGKADCATVIAPSGALADAAATELGNRVRQPGDVEGGLDWALSVPGVKGAAVIVGDALGVRGELELVPLGRGKEKTCKV